MDSAGLKQKAARFASLQAAHRALARSVHPAELTAVREQSRTLLIALRDLAASARSGADVNPEMLRTVDSALEVQTERTLAILSKIELSQMRASIPQLVTEHPDEVKGLLDVLLAGDLDDGKTMRTLEYLITMLAAEERGGRRIIARDPCKVTPALGAVAARLSSSTDEKYMVAERVLEGASVKVMQNEEIGEIRDRVRRYKEELGAGLLHPRVLAATVTYNVAMWNQVAAEIDSSRAIEQLAEELFDSASQAPAENRASTTDSQQVLGSRGFGDVVAAFRARTLGEGAGAGPATRVAAALPLETLRAEDTEVFEDEQVDEASWMMREAIVLGLILRCRSEIEPDLCELDLAPERLADMCVQDLMERMSDLARKRFAESNYGEAFRLSDIKMHSLAAHARRKAATKTIGAGPTRGSAATASAGGGLRTLLGAIASGPALALLAITAAVVAFLAMPSLTERGDASEAPAAAQISPFLEWGRENRNETPPRFVGRLSPAWDYVGTPERRFVVEEIGQRLEARGISHVALMDTRRLTAARYANGDILLLAPHHSDAEN